MINKNNLKIKDLEKLANTILILKNELRQRRPIVIEFCGSPKSGKTACINSLNIFLKRNGFKTQILTERANVCPIPSKYDPFFNIWTSSASISELVKCLSVDSTKTDLIILDRGIFDSICWFTWLKTKNYLNQKNYFPIMKYLTLEIWRRYIDLIYVFKVTPETSMEREYKNLLTRKYGSIMNPETLNEFNIAIDQSVNQYSQYFKKLDQIDTSQYKQNEVSGVVTRNILETLKNMLIEKVGFFDFSTNKIGLNYGINDFEKINKIEYLKFSNRDEVEEKENLQPVPIAVFANRKRDSVLVLKKQRKSLNANSPEKNKLLLYAGGHIREEDNLEGKSEPLINVIKKTLNREIKEELGISIYPSENDKPFLIYTPADDRINKHIAICFIFEIDFEKNKFRMDKREIIQKKGKTESGRSLSIASIKKKIDKFEPWSKLILERVFNIKLDLNEQLIFKNF